MFFGTAPPWSCPLLLIERTYKDLGAGWQIFNFSIPFKVFCFVDLSSFCDRCLIRVHLRLERFHNEFVHHKLFLEWQHRYRDFRHALGRKYLPRYQLLHLFLAQSEAYLLNRIFADVFVFVLLVGLFDKTVDVEVTVFYDQLLFKCLNLLLPHLSKFFVHVFARDEDRLKELWIWECLSTGDLALEIRLAVICWVVDRILKFFLLVLHRLCVRDFHIIDGWLSGLLRVLIPVLSLHDLVKAVFSLPLLFVLRFFLHDKLCLID